MCDDPHPSGEDTGVSYLRDALKIALVHTQQETLANLRYRVHWLPAHFFRE